MLQRRGSGMARFQIQASSLLPGSVAITRPGFDLRATTRSRQVMTAGQLPPDLWAHRL
jgi:hypothetical protein